MKRPAGSQTFDISDRYDLNFSSGNNPLYFIPHPWSATGTTNLFASAFMRAGHPTKLQAYTVSGEPAYLETTEIMLKEALFKSGKQKPQL